jgi:hexosaminidase
MRVAVVEAGDPAFLTIAVTPGAVAAEGYDLTIRHDGISIIAADPSGAVYAVQTLRQLLPAAGYRLRPPAGTLWNVPCCRVADHPRFAWRGALLDVARHFLPKHEVLRHIDMLSIHKINRLQLHLTDEQGWRIESSRHPRLTQTGAWRRETQHSHHRDAALFDGTPHGGFYSKADLREIFDHAADRAILLVPEIELPGHTGALIAAYPELGAPLRDDRAVLGTWGLHDTLVAPTEANFATLESILDEVCAVLPGPYVHVGGDESRLDGWDQDPRVRDYAAARGLTSTAALFGDFMRRLQDILAARGRTMITWDDSFATQQHVPTARAGDAALIMAWRGLEVARRAAAAGRGVILAPVQPTYFDYAQSDDPAEPLAIGGPVTLDDVLAWEPIPPEWRATERANVLGLQCQVWTEYIATPRRVDFMLYPRLCAFADLAWGGDATGRAARVGRHLPRLDAAGIEYRPITGPHPWQAGGTGRLRHRVPAPMQAVLALHAQAADAGKTPDEETYRSFGAPG